MREAAPVTGLFVLYHPWTASATLDGQVLKHSFTYSLHLFMLTAGR